MLRKAEQLINQQKSAEAYELLFAQYEQHAGTPDFDLLLGIAALDSGHPSQAVFAFECVLAMYPPKLAPFTRSLRQILSLVQADSVFQVRVLEHYRELSFSGLRRKECLTRTINITIEHDIQDTDVIASEAGFPYELAVP